MDTYSAELPVGEKVLVLEIMDTAGQEDLVKIRKLAYPGTHCVLLCYNVVAPQSLENVENFWDGELSTKIPQVPIVLCGNKLDLKDAQVKKYIDDDRAEKTVGAIDRIQAHIQCSALDEINNPENYTVDTSLVNTAFQFAIKYGLEYRLNGPTVTFCSKCAIL